MTPYGTGAMTMPLALLAWSAFFGLLHAVATGAAVTSQHGLEYASSARDEQKPLSPGRSRLVRSFANFMQTFPIFAVAVLAAHAVHRDHGLASWGAQFYFWARLVYVPLYMSGSKYRTPVYLVSVLGILMVFLRIA